MPPKEPQDAGTPAPHEYSPQEARDLGKIAGYSGSSQWSMGQDIVNGAEEFGMTPVERLKS